MKNITSILFLLFAFSAHSFAQVELPIDEKSGRVVFEGEKKIDQKKKKLIMEGMNAWVSKKLDYPPMVFSVIKAEKDTLMVKVVTEVPSLKQLHPVSFRLILVPGKRKFNFRASEFYFEDIKLSLEDWLKKFKDSDNKRHQRNYELITSGLDSYIFMSMSKLAEEFKEN